MRIYLWGSEVYTSPNLSASTVTSIFILQSVFTERLSVLFSVLVKVKRHRRNTNRGCWKKKEQYKKQTDKSEGQRHHEAVCFVSVNPAL